jgi:hypothetical protein
MSEIERIRFLRQLVGPRVNRRVGDKAWVGDEAGQVSAAEARRLLGAGYIEVLRGGEGKAPAPTKPPEPEPVEEVEEVAAEPIIETATVEPAENAAVRTRRPPGRPRKKR